MRRNATLGLLLTLATTLGASPRASALPSEGLPTGLFSDAPNQTKIAQSDEPWVVRQRAVEVEFAQLEAQRRSDQAFSLRLNLFTDVDLLATLERAVENRSGSISWVGSVEDPPGGSAILVFKDRVLVGSVRVPGAIYQIVHLGAGAHALQEIDASLLPGEEPPGEVFFTPEELWAAAKAPLGSDPADLYDLQVVYTPLARQNAGGTTAMENLIDLGIAESNQSYAISGIPIQVRLVHSEEIDYTESGSLVTDRNRLQNPSDGFMDQVHTMRNTYGADVTTLVIEDPGCGIAYIMNPVSSAFEAFAFNVTKRACVSPNYTFEHEIGHLQSARHDWFVDPTNNAPFSFNHGYVDPESRWRSIMAYSNACGGCTRELFWSNPDRLHPVTGNPTGIAEGQPSAADNRKTLTLTAATVANFRQRLDAIFIDGFESGGTGLWSMTIP